MGYRFPGDVRALENPIRCEYLQSENETPDCRNLKSDTQNFVGTGDPSIPLDQPFAVDKKSIVRVFAEAYLTAMMEKFHGNVTHAA